MPARDPRTTASLFFQLDSHLTTAVVKKGLC
jgi:hypothetical protein